MSMDLWSQTFFQGYYTDYFLQKSLLLQMNAFKFFLSTQVFQEYFRRLVNLCNMFVELFLQLKLFLNFFLLKATVIPDVSWCLEFNRC